MIIKRGFSLLGIIPRYRVFVNNELISKLRVFQQVDVEMNDEVVLFFEAGFILESRKIRIKNMNIYKITVNVNPLIRILEGFLFLILLIGFFLRSNGFTQYILVYDIGLLVVASLILILFFATDFFHIKYYDADGKRIILKDIDEYINKNDI